MKTIVLLLTCVILFFCNGDVFASEILDTVAQVEHESSKRVSQSLEISEAFTRITGTAIYPVFGLAMLGMWDHTHDIHTWYATPFLYIPLLCILLIDFLKNTIGLAFGPFKKVVDILMQVLDLINGHLGLFMSIGIAANSFNSPVEQFARTLHATIIPVAEANSFEPESSHTWAVLLMVISGIIGGLVYSIIWVLNQSFALLILLSPFTFLDSILRSIQITAISILTISFLIFPLLGVIVGCIYCIIAMRMLRFCWSHLRFSTTILFLYLFRRGKFDPTLKQGIACFSDTGMSNLYPRTFGHIVSEEASLYFRTVATVGTAQTHAIQVNGLYIQRNTLTPTLCIDVNNSRLNIATLSPQYKGSEDCLAQYLSCTVQQGSLVKGFQTGLQYIQNFSQSLTKQYK